MYSGPVDCYEDGGCSRELRDDSPWDPDAEFFEDGGGDPEFTTVLREDSPDYYPQWHPDAKFSDNEELPLNPSNSVDTAVGSNNLQESSTNAHQSTLPTSSDVSVCYNSTNVLEGLPVLSFKSFCSNSDNANELAVLKWRKRERDVFGQFRLQSDRRGSSWDELMGPLQEYGTDWFTSSMNELMQIEPWTFDDLQRNFVISYHQSAEPSPSGTNDPKMSTNIRNKDSMSTCTVTLYNALIVGQSTGTSRYCSRRNDALCKCIVVTALMQNFIDPVVNWDGSHLDKIMTKGHKVFADIYTGTAMRRQEYLPFEIDLKEIEVKFVFGKKVYLCNHVENLSFTGKGDEFFSQLNRHISFAPKTTRNVMISYNNLSYALSVTADGLSFYLLDCSIIQGKGVSVKHGPARLMVFDGLRKAFDFLESKIVNTRLLFKCTPFRQRWADKSKVESHLCISIRKYKRNDYETESSTDTDDMSDYECDGAPKSSSGRVIKKVVQYASEDHPSFYRGKRREDLKRRNTNKKMRLSSATAETKQNRDSDIDRKQKEEQYRKYIKATSK